MLANLSEIFRNFSNATFVALLVSFACALLGVFVILKRIVFIGITLSEVAACGVALSLLTGCSPFLGAIALCLIVVIFLSYPFENLNLPRDAILGFIFVAAACLSILLVSQSGFGLEEIRSVLYGNILFASSNDLKTICLILLPIIVIFIMFLKPILYSFLDRDSAQVLGLRPALWEFVYFFLLGVTIAASSKITGSVLVFCYLIIGPSLALLVTRKFLWVIVISVVVNLLSTIIGMYWSFTKDLPTNQTISAFACIIFACGLFACLVKKIPEIAKMFSPSRN